MLSVQGPVIDWVADHRKHHAHTDVEGDPHSPHVGHGDGVMGALRGLWHAHVGWLWRTHGEARARKYAKDLVEDRGMRILNRKFPLDRARVAADPGGARRAADHELVGRASPACIWGGFVRIFFQHHVTWSVNSVCHFFGKRRFDIEDHSTNVFWLAIPSFGESWHHNHHAFPRSAAHGLKWWEIDPSAALIALMKRVGLAWDVVKITPERQAQKLVGAPKPEPKRAAPAEPSRRRSPSRSPSRRRDQRVLRPRYELDPRETERSDRDPRYRSGGRSRRPTLPQCRSSPASGGSTPR